MCGQATSRAPFAFAALLAAGCVERPRVAIPPTAEAGPDRMAVLGATVTLDGTASRTADGEGAAALSFTWSIVAKPQGSAADLVNPTSPRPTFLIDAVGAFIFRLVVRDGDVEGRPDVVVIRGYRPLSVVAQTPPDGSFDARPDSQIMVVFSEPVQAESVTHRSFHLLDGRAQIPGTLALYEGNTVALLKPSQDLPAGRRLRAVVTSGVVSLSGQSLAVNYWSHFMVAATGTRPPEVLSLAPADGSVGVASSISIVVTFDESVNPATLTQDTIGDRCFDNFLVVDSLGQCVPGTLEITAEQRFAFTPDAALAAGETYTITLKGGALGIADRAGNPLAADEVASFIVAAAPDLTPPAVTSVYPGHKYDLVPLGAQITVVFSEAMAPASLRAIPAAQPSFSLEKAGSDVPGTFALSAGKRVLTFTPGALLEPATTYLVTLRGGGVAPATDVAGVALDGNGDGSAGGDFTSRFTTDQLRHYNGVFTLPGSVAPGQDINILLRDRDLDVSSSADVVAITMTSSNTERELLVLTETAAASGDFQGSVRTVYGPSAATDNDGIVNAESGDVLSFVYDDELSVEGVPAQVLATVGVSGGVDGALTVDAQRTPGQTVSISVDDPDLNTSDAGLNSTTVTLVSNRGEQETVTLLESSPTSGVFQGTVATIFGTGSPSKSGDGRLEVQSGDSATTTYIDTQTLTGGSANVTAPTSFLGGQVIALTLGPASAQEGAGVLLSQGRVAIPGVLGADLVVDLISSDTSELTVPATVTIPAGSPVALFDLTVIDDLEIDATQTATVTASAAGWTAGAGAIDITDNESRTITVSIPTSAGEPDGVLVGMGVVTLPGTFAADLVVSLSSSDTTELSVPASVTLPAGSTSIAFDLTVIDDNVIDGTQRVTVTAATASWTSGSDAIDIVDNESPTLTVSVPASASEGNGVLVKQGLVSIPGTLTTDLGVFLTSADTGELTVPVAVIILAGTTSTTFDLTVVDDNEIDGTRTVEIRAFATGWNTGTDLIDILDNETRSLSVSVVPAYASESDGTLLGQGVVSILGTYVADLTVTLGTNDATELSVPAAVTIAAGSTSANFDLTVIDDTQVDGAVLVTVTGQAAGWTSGSDTLEIRDNESQTLILSIVPLAASEGAGVLVGQGRVSIPGTWPTDLVVTLGSSDTTNLTAPISATIPAGSTSATFDLTVVDDTRIDGTVTVTLTASVTGWAAGTDAIDILDNETRTLTLTLNPLSATEGAGALTGQGGVSIPGTFAASLVVTISSNDTTELTVPAFVTIPAGSTSVVFDLTVVDDAEIDGAQAVTVTAAAASWISSTDGLSILDNETQTLTLAMAPPSAVETAGVLTAQGSVAISGTYATSVVVALISNDTTELTVPVSVTIPAGSTSATFNLTVVDDTLIDGTQTVTVTGTATGWSAGSDTIDILDSETRTLTLNITPLSATEGAGVLTGQASISIPGTFASNLVVTLGSSDITELSVPASVTIPAGATSTTFSVTVVDDTLVDGTQTVTVTGSASGWTSGGDAMDILDNETQTLTLTLTPLPASEGAGVLTGQATVSIPGSFATNLVVTLSSNDTTELTVPASVTIPAGATSATFDLTVVDDTVIDGSQSVTVTASATGWTAGSDSINILDNETLTFTLSITPLSALETAGVLVGQASVAIPGTFASNVVVLLASNDVTELAVPASVTLLAGATSVSFAITVVDDTLIDGTQTVSVTGSATGWTSGSDTIDILDNETQTLALAIVPPSATEGAGVLPGQGNVTIPGTLSTNLVVSLASSDTTELTVPATVTILAGATSATFDVTVVDDTLIDGTQTASVTGSVTGWASGSDSINILDNETLTLALTLTPLSATEGAGVLTGQGSVSIPGTFTASLVVTLSSNDTSELTVPASITIPAGSTSAVFALTVVDDTLIDGSQPVTVTASAAGWTSGSDSLNILDNETQTLTLNLIPASAVESAGVLAAQGSVSIPGTWPAALTVTLTSSDTTELTVPATVTIPAGATSATFDLTVVDDIAIDGTQTVIVTGTATGWTAGSDSMSVLDNESPTLTVTLPPSANEGAGVLVGQGRVSIPGTSPLDLGVTLTSSDSTEITVPAAIIIPAGTTSVTFNITVVEDTLIDGTQPVTITATATGWNSGASSIDVLDNETRVITLAIAPVSVSEGAGVLTGQGSVSLTGTFATNLVVTLSSSDTTEVTVPASVTILAGSTTAIFNLTVVDDTLIDGSQTAIVTGSATGWSQGTDTLSVLDNESQTIALAITPTSASEGAGVLAAQGSVSIPGTWPSSLVVTLSSNDTTELSVPASVTIPAGSTSASFDLSVVDDAQIDGSQTVTVTGSAVGWTSGTDTLSVLDNETQTITLAMAPVSALETAGVLVGQGSVSIPGTWPANLVVTLASNDSTELTVPATVTILAGSTSAIFNLTLVDDTLIDGTQAVTVTGSATGWTAGSDSLDVLDNETQTLTVTLTPASALETAGVLVGQGSVSIPGAWPANLVVTLTSNDTTELTVPLSVTIPTGATSATFNLTAVDDTAIDGTQIVTVTGSATGWTAGSDTIDVLDNETQTISVVLAPASASEGDGVLVGQGSVSIPGTWPASLVVTLSSNDTTELSVPPSVTIPAGSTSAVFDLTVVDETLIDGAQAVTVTGSASGWTPGSDAISILDNEAQTITLAVAPVSALETAGVLVGQGNVSIPGTWPANLVVTLSSNDTTEITVPLSVTIPAGATSATFNLTAVDDTAIDGTQAVTVTGSATGWTSGSDTLNILDNETQTITLAVAPASASEGDGVLVGQGTVSIPGTWPVNLVVTLSSNDTTEITVPAAVTILAGSTVAVFDLTVVNDTLIDGTQTATVTGSATGWTAGSDAINVLDNETRVITLAMAPPSASEVGGTLVGQGSVSITGTLAASLVVTLSSTDTTELTVPPTVTIPAGSTSAVFDLTVVDDTLIDGTQTVTVTGSAATWTSGSDTIDILDNETQTFTLAIAPLSASEGAGVLTGQGSVSIPGTFAASVVVTLTSNDVTELTVPASVTIPAGSTSAVFNLTVVDDTLIDGTQTVTVTGSATGWTSGSDTLNILDNETQTLTLAITPASVLETAGVVTGQASVSIPGAWPTNLVVALSSSDTTELTVAALVTIVAGSTSVSFNLTAVDDTLIDGTQDVTVTASSAGWTSGSDLLSILDNETKTLTLAIAPLSATEGAGVLVGQGSVSIPGSWPSSLVVTLGSSDATELTVPASVTIPAGALSVNFDLTVVDDTLIDGSQTVTVTASASTWTSGADTITVLDNETQTLTVTLTPVSASEGAGVLVGQGSVSIPGTFAASVIVTLSSNDTSELTVPASVTIPTGSTSALFDLSVVDDTLIDGAQGVTVTASATGWTSGTDTISILDNESQTITLAILPASAPESAGVLTGQGSVSIPGTWPSNLVVTLTSSDTTELTVPATVIIVAGSTSAVFSPTVLDDTLIDGAQLVTVTGSATGWTSGSDTISILDDETQTITLTLTPPSASEAAGVLAGQGSVSIPGVLAANLVVTLSSSDTSEVTVPASVTLLAGSTSATFSLTVVDDTEIDGTITVTISGAATGWNTGSDTIDILDDETRLLTVTLPSTAKEGDGVLTGQGLVSISGTFVANLVVTLGSNDTTELTVPASVTILAGSTSATFNPTVVDDTLIDGTQAATITGSATGWTSGSSIVNVTDNETQTLTVNITPASATEGEGVLTGQGSVSISGTWPASLVVSLASNDTTELTVPVSVTIPSGSTSATFSLTVVDDTLIDGTQTVTVTGSATGWTSGSDTLNVLDNESLTLTLAITPVSALESAGVLTGQGSVSIPGTWPSNLVVTLSSNDTTELTLPAAVTILTGSTSATFNLTVVDDTLIDGTQLVTVTASASGWTSGSDTLSVLDNETQTLTVAISPLAATEGAGVLAAQGSVSIPGTWPASLVVTLSSNDTTELGVPTSVTIPAGSTSALFDLTVIDDTLIDGPQIVTVTASATGWTAGSDTIDILDNETQTLTLAIAPLSATEGTGVLAGQGSVSIPGTFASPLVVMLSSSDTTELTVPLSISIPAGATSALFDLTVVDDTLIDGPQIVTVTGTSTGWTSGSDTLSVLDNETQTITLTITPVSALETAGVLTAQGSVTIPGTLTANLVVTLASNDTTELTVPASATIPAGSTSVTFNLTVVDDTLIDGPQAVTVTGSAVGWTPGSDTINVLDNETLTLSVAIAPLSAAEGAGVLAGQGSVSIPGTFASSVLVTLASNDLTELTVPASVTIPAGATSATFDLTVVDDTVIDGAQTVTVTASATGWTSGSDTITILDNETQTLTLALAPVSASEGDGVLTGQGSVSISGTFASSVVVTLASSDTSELTVPASVTIPAGSTSAIFNLAVVEDTLIDGAQTVTVTGSAAGWTSGSDTINILDNETQTIIVSITPASALETAGALTGQGSVSIPGTWPADLVVTLTSNDTTELTVPATVTIAAGSTSAAFTPTVVDDALIDGSQTVTVTGSAVGWTSGSDAITILDNETQTLTLAIAPASALEGDGVLTGQGNVTIPGAFATNLVVALTSSDTTELTVPTSVTIPAGATSAIFNLTVVDDTLIDGTQSVTVTGSAVGWTSGSDAIAIVDNETQTLTLAIGPASASEGSGVLTGQGSVSIPGTTAANLVVTLSSNDLSELTVPASVTIPAGATSAVFNLTVVDDVLIDGTQSVTVTGSAVGWTSGSDAIDILDNETKTITVALLPPSALENAGVLVGQGSVSIPGTWPASLVVALSSSDTTELAIPVSVTIPAGATSVAFDLTVVDDNQIDGTVTVTVTGTSTGWAPGSDVIDILDNETKTLTLAITPLTATEGDGVLAGQGAVSIPGTLPSSLIVTLTSLDPTEVTVPGSVTIPAGSTSALFSLTVVDDIEVDGTVGVTVTASATGWTSGSDTLDILDNESRTLSLNIVPASAVETAGLLAGQGTVSIPGTFAANLTITLVSSDTSELTVPASVTIPVGFTSATFDLTVIDDALIDGAQIVTVTGSAAGWAAGSDTISILDNETPAITLAIAPVSAVETAGVLVGQGSVSIPSAQAASLVITLSSSDTTEVTVPASVTIPAGATSAVFDLTVVDDTLIDGTVTVSVTGSATGWNNGSDAIAILDNETKTLTLAVTPPSATEGAGVLVGQGSVSIPGTWPSDLVVTLGSSDTTELTVPAPVTIPAGATSATFSLTVVDDTLIDGTQTVTVTGSAAGWIAGSDTIDILDNEPKIITLAIAPLAAREGDGVLVGQGSASISGTFGADVVVTLSSNDTTELTVPASVTIPAGSTSAIFSLTVVDDTAIDGTQTVTVIGSATGWTSGSDTLDILDNESQTLTLAITPVSATEGAGVLTGQASVSIPGTLAANLVVTLSSNDATELTVPASVTILAGSTLAAFNLTVVDDTLIDGTQTVTVTGSATGWTSGSDTLTILDNETQTLTVTITPLSALETAGVLTGQGSVAIPGAFPSNLVVTLSSSDTTELTVPASVTITAGSTSASFNLTVVDDTLIDGTQVVTVTGSATGWTSGSDALDILDSETQTLTLAIAPLSALETAGLLTAQGSVAILGTLATNLVVSLSSNDTSELTVPVSVTILAGATSATFNLTVVDDTLIDGTQTVTVTGSVTGWTSGSDAIDILDNETQTISLSIAPLSAGEGAGVLVGQGSVSIPGTLATNLVVTLSSNDTTELTVPVSVTILAGSTSAAFNLTVVDDTAIDGTQVVTVTGSAAGWISGADTIDILDNETQTIALAIAPLSASEGAGVLVGQGSVTIPGTFATNLVVSLSSNDTTELTVPVSVTIVAGSTSASFNLTVVDDPLIDGTQTVTVAGSATGWTSGADTIDILDNETLTLTLSIAPLSASEGDGVLAGQGSVTIPGAFGSNLVVTLSSNDTTELTVPASVTILAGSTSAIFDLTVVNDTLIDGAQTVTVTGSASGWTSGSDTINVLDNETQTITLTLTPPSATEGAGVLTAQGSVSIPGAFASNLVVTLSSNDTTELTVPASVTILAGSTSAAFDVTVVDDTLIDGTQTVTATGSATGWTSGSDTINILDNETLTIALAITPLSASEGAGVLASQGSVSIPGTWPTNLVVTLSSNDSTEITVPASVTILAGSTSAAFNLTVVDDTIIDGTQVVTVTGSATGWTQGTDTIDVLDNETQTLTLSIGPVSALETDGVLIGQGSVSIPGTFATNLVVTLASSDTTELTVPASVTIPAGSTSAVFNLTVVDDTQIDGTVAVIVTGSATGWTSGTDTISILDNETQTLTLAITPLSASEGAGVLTGAGSVSIPGTFGTNLVVTLTSSDTSELTVPASVTIVAGTTSAAFNLTVVDDTISDGTQTVTVTGSATGWTSGADTIAILDDELSCASRLVTAAVGAFSTASATFVDVTAGSVTFTPAAAGDIWVILLSSRLSSTTTTGVEARYLVNGIEHGVGSRYAFSATIGSWQHFYRVTGTTAPQSVQVQLQATGGATATISDLRIIALKMPAGADFQFAETEAIQSVTAGVWSTYQTLTFTATSPGDYLVMGLSTSNELPGANSIGLRFQDPGLFNWPVDVPAGLAIGHYANTRGNWQSTFVARTQNLSGSNTYRVQANGSTGGSQIRYTRLMAFRVDAFSSYEFVQDLAETSTTSTTPIVKSTLTTAVPPASRDYLTLQMQGIGGDAAGSGNARKSSFRRNGVDQTSFAHDMDLSYYRTSYGMFDLHTTAAGVTYQNTFSSSVGTRTVTSKESVIHVLSQPACVP